MKRTKMQRGITLVALIITIVILIILAVVAITSIQKDGILTYAENATSIYDKSQTNEAGIIGGYTNRVDDFFGTNSGESGEDETDEPEQCEHSWSAWSKVTEANCATKTDETEERTCSKCGEKESKITNYYVHQNYGWAECSVCGEACNETEYVTSITSTEKDENYSRVQYHSIFKRCVHCADPEIDTEEPCTFANYECTVCGADCRHYQLDGSMRFGSM